MKVRVISDGDQYVVQTKTRWWPFWRLSNEEYNGTKHLAFTQQDYALKFIATTILKPKPKKPRWVVVLNHHEVVEKIEKCVHDPSARD